MYSSTLMTTMRITIRLTTLLTAVSFLWKIDFAGGQSVDVTESTMLAHHAADYEYENINTGIATNNNISADNYTDRAKSPTNAEGGLFYPLYGEAINRIKQLSESHTPHGGTDLSPVMPSKTNDSTPSAVLDNPDYISIDEPPSPERRVETLKLWKGPPGQNTFNRWVGEEGVPGIFREDYHTIMDEGPWTQKAVRMGNRGGMWGEDMMETLRKEFQIIRHYKLNERLKELQYMYPYINVTHMYSIYNKQPIGDRLLYGGMDDRGSSNGYWYNGTLYYYAPDFEADDGFWHNGTFYPVMEHETDDGFWFNGTFYAGEWPDLEDGYFYNGTFYYTGETEGADIEDGFFHNGTFYPGIPEEQDEGRDWYEEEDLMWWQLHHPRWRNRGNAVEQPWKQRGGRVEAERLHSLPPSLYPPNGLPVYNVHHLPSSADHPRRKPFPPTFPWNPSKSNTMSGSGLIKHLLPRPQQINYPQGAGQHRNGQTSKLQQSFYGQMYPMRRGRPSTLQRGLPSEKITQMRDRYRAFQEQRQAARFIKPRVRQNRPLSQSTKNNPLPPYNERTILQNSKGSRGSSAAGQLTGNQGAKAQAMMLGSHSSNAASNEGTPINFKKTDPLDPYRDTSTMTIGITIACVIALMLIVAPLGCMLYTYRQNKRMKKRTLLRRPELSGSVDEDLVDAMVRTELGAVGGTKHSGPSSENSTRQSLRGENTSRVVKEKSRGNERTENQRKETKRWSLGRSATKSKNGKESERGGMDNIEMRDMGYIKRNRPLPSCPDQPSPSSMRSSFLYHHSRHAPRNTGTDEKEQRQRLMSRPMSIVGMDSEDEVQVVGKQN